MTERLEVQECALCGNLVEVLHSGGGQLVYCGQPMKFLEEKTEEQGREKHLPAAEKTDDGISVKIGDVLHPMEERHHIEWPEVVVKDGVTRKFLKPHGAPEVALEIEGDFLQARAYCSIHGPLTEKEV